jgi:hypothetical protein
MRYIHVHTGKLLTIRQMFPERLELSQQAKRNLTVRFLMNTVAEHIKKLRKQKLRHRSLVVVVYKMPLGNSNAGSETKEEEAFFVRLTNNGTTIQSLLAWLPRILDLSPKVSYGPWIMCR